MRHSCEQGDGLAGYTWTEHDVREGGVQVLKDPKNNVEITTEFLKFPGGEHGGSWAARIKGRPSNPGMRTAPSHDPAEPDPPRLPFKNVLDLLHWY